MTEQRFAINLLGGEYATDMTCRDAGCVAWAEGWLSVLDTENPAHAGAATWIKEQSGRKFYEWRGASAIEEAARLEAQGALTVTPALRQCLESLTASMVVFYFHPGQRCFKEHLDREVKFYHRTRLSTREHVRPLDWNEHMNEETYKVNRIRERG